MDPVTQETAFGATEMGAGDAARFWRHARHDGLECLAARFRTHRYAPHAHDTFVVGVITAGCESFRLRGAARLAAAGDLCFVNPGEAHDGAPVGEGYSYRMSYPSAALLTDLAEDLTGRRPAAVPAFREPVVRDGQAAALFLAAHRALEGGQGRLGADEHLVRAFNLALARHSDLGAGSGPAGREAGAVRRARDYLEAHLADDVDLGTLAAVAGLGRTQLIRAFRRETGLTPHAWATDRRVRTAQEMLRSGESPAEVAAATGFFDQAHFTRAFKARLGVTPGVYRGARLA